MSCLARTSVSVGPGPIDDRATVAERLAWLVRLRWFAIAGVVAAAVLAARLGILATPTPLLAVAATMLLANLYWYRDVRRARALELGRRSDRARLVVWQILFDVAALTALLAASGGADNPFAVFFAFPMAIGAMLLRPLAAARIGFLGAFLWTALVLTQRGGLLPIVAFADEPPSPSLHVAAGRIVGMSLMMFGIVYFVQSVAERLRLADRRRLERERQSLLLERFARVGELSAGVAHAIRNPLHGLLNSVELLDGRCNGDVDTREVLSLMAEALRRIETVTQRLLDLTREAPLVRVPTDMDAFAEETLRLVSPRARGSAAQIEAELGHVGECDVDAVYLGEALANVLNNAVDACAVGGRVVLRTALGSDPDATVVLEVVDTGTGIASEHLAMVFAPFFTTKPVGEGTGIGLAITRRVVEGHGGTVTVESTLGEGTTVRFIIPRHARQLPVGGDEA